jgi:hypothetical protein
VIDWQSVAYGVCASILFICGVLLVTIAIEARAARPLDWILDRLERAAGRIENKLSGVLVGERDGRDVPDGE